MRGPLFLVVLGVLVIIVAVLAAFGVLPDSYDAIADVAVKVVLWVSGSLITFAVIAYGAWNVAPDPLKRLSASALQIVPNLPNGLKRRAVKNKLEGQLNSAFKSFGKKGDGFVGPEIEVRWLTPGDQAREEFFAGNKAYIRLNYSDNNDINLVRGALIFCRDTFLVSTRQYVSRPLMRALELTFIDEILENRKAVQSRAYFVHEVLPRLLDDAPETKTYMDQLELISQHGTFLRVLIPELNDYPGYVPARLGRQVHQSEIEGFINFLDRTSKGRERITDGAGLIYVHPSIRTGIVLVGIIDKLMREGTRPYVRRVAIDGDRGCRTVYLIGYNVGIDYVEPIAQECKTRGIVDNYKLDKYEVWVRGSRSKQIIARLSVPDGAGSAFLQEHPNTDEWPDLPEQAFENGKKEG